MPFLLFGLIICQLLLLLLYATMVDLLEVSLFTQLVIGRSCLLRDNSRLVQLFLEHCQLVWQFGVLSVDFRDLGQARGQSSIRLVLAHLLLEGLERAPHPKLNEEVSDELITLFASCCAGTYNAHLLLLLVIYLHKKTTNQLRKRSYKISMVAHDAPYLPTMCSFFWVCWISRL